MSLSWWHSPMSRKYHVRYWPNMTRDLLFDWLLIIVCHTQCMHNSVHCGTHVEIRGQRCGVYSLFLLLDSKNQSQATRVISEARFLTEPSSHWFNYGLSKCNFWLCSRVSLWRSCLWFRWCLNRWPLVTPNIYYSAYVGLVALSPQPPLSAALTTCVRAQ